MRWSLRLLITLLFTHCLPIVVVLVLLHLTAWGAALWMFATGFTIAIIFALSHYSALVRSLHELENHAQATSKNQFTTRNTDKLPGAFGRIGSHLNQIANKLQEFNSRSAAESEVIVAEANRLRMILNSIKDGVLALDKNKHIILFNRAAGDITGLHFNDAAGRHINEVLPLMQNKRLAISEWIDECEGADMQQSQWEGITFAYAHDYEVSLDIEALYTGADPNGVRTLITFHNRTEEQQIEDMKVDFVALAAHELRTPVTVIRGYIEILNNETADRLDPEYQEFLRKLEVSAAQLAGSINNILHVSHIEHGELNLSMETIDWHDIVKAVVSELSEKAHTQKKTIHVDIPEELPYIAADRVSITEVLTNLVDNALKYSEPGQEIEVRAWHDEETKTVKTAVVDHGVGMPDNAIGKLFTKFYRSHRTRSSHRGTGLGLYMSKSIIEAHNGTIQVESKEGEGSTFTFELPTVAKHKDDTDNEGITRGVHGWIKNHSLYRG